MPVKNPDNIGGKINKSRYVFHVVKMIYEGMPLARIPGLLKERFNYSVSLPSVSSFKKNFYDKRLKEMQALSNAFQEEQNSKIKSFVDEASGQASSLKKAINSLDNHLNMLEEDIGFSHKFNKLFRNSVDKFVDGFDVDNSRQLFEIGEDCSEEEKAISDILNGFGDNRDLVFHYISNHNPNNAMRLLASLHKQLLDHRVAIEKIYKDIFKSYRNYSIMQEITVIFEKYNGIIIEEFFSDRNNINAEKYNSVRKKIFALFQELQIRYQGVDMPEEDKVKEVLDEKHTKVKKNKKNPKKSNKKGKKYDFSDKIKINGKPPEPVEEELTDADIESIYKEVLERAKLRNKDGSSSIDIDKTVLSKSRKNNNLKGKDSNE